LFSTGDPFLDLMVGFGLYLMFSAIGRSLRFMLKSPMAFSLWLVRKQPLWMEELILRCLPKRALPSKKPVHQDKQEEKHRNPEDEQDDEPAVCDHPLEPGAKP